MRLNEAQAETDFSQLRKKEEKANCAVASVICCCWLQQVIL
jgi:hypothetical protein